MQQHNPPLRIHAQSVGIGDAWESALDTWDKVPNLHLRHLPIITPFIATKTCIRTGFNPRFDIFRPMKIDELHLLSYDLDAQEVFYSSTLGLMTERRADDLLDVRCGESMLTFHPTTSHAFYYHFCFLIPTGSLEGAISFAEEQELNLLLNKGETITHFDHGRSIYFHDGNQNIAEFIERPLVDYPVKESFGIEDLIRINEIGLPTAGPKQVANDICKDHGIIPIAPANFNNVFCWVGDHEGVIIVVKEGRGWLPTDRPGISSPFKVLYREKSKPFAYHHDWPVS